MIKKIRANIFKGSVVYLLVTFLLTLILNACGTKPVEIIPAQQPAATIEAISLPTPTPTLIPPSDSHPTTQLPVSTEVSQNSDINPPSQTVNGYTATIESYYIDSFHLIFHVRVTGGKMFFGNKDFFGSIGHLALYDANGNFMNTSTGGGPASDLDVHEFEFMPPSWSPFLGDHLQGQFVFAIEDSADSNRILAQFRFDFYLPIYNTLTFNPKQAATANGLQVLLDRVTVTPAFTQVYLCFPSPSYANWQMGSDSILQLDGQQVALHSGFLLFDPNPIIGDRTIGTEPEWVLPTKEDRCIKYRFAIGSASPASLTLTIPDLENSSPQAMNIILTDQLAKDYPGMTPRQAYHKYLEDIGNTYKGPWVFTVSLKP